MIPRYPEATLTEQLTELSRARDQYKSAFEKVADAMVVINDEARILDANHKASQIYGLERQEF